MQPFAFERVDSPAAAVRAAAGAHTGSVLQNPVQYLAGGTTLLTSQTLATGDGQR